MKVLECMKIDEENYNNITFIRIDPEDLAVTIKDIINSFSDMAWITKFDEGYMRNSFYKRADETAKYLADKLSKEIDDNIIKDSGEYVVSELARKALINEMKYLDVPLAELFKKKVVGNPGFDFYSANLEKIIIFGEAKYDSNNNSYGRSMGQVNRFIEQEKDITDLNDIDKFFEIESLNKANNGEKAYAIAFSSKDIQSKDLIKNIINNKYYKNLAMHKEVIYLAVNV